MDAAYSIAHANLLRLPSRTEAIGKDDENTHTIAKIVTKKIGHMLLFRALI